MSCSPHPAWTTRERTFRSASSALIGPYAWAGEPHLAGTELAIADVNAQGGVLGEPLQLIVADDACDAEPAPLAAQKLVSEAVAVAFGATRSGAAISASKIFRRAGILMIEADATNPQLTEEGEGRVFRIVGRDDRQGTIADDYLADRWKDSNITIVHDTSAYGKGLAEEVKKRLNQRGVAEVLRRERFDTVLGRIGFDEKGDVTGSDPFAWYVWQADGSYVPLEQSSAKQ